MRTLTCRYLSGRLWMPGLCLAFIALSSWYLYHVGQALAALGYLVLILIGFIAELGIPLWWEATGPSEIRVEGGRLLLSWRGQILSFEFGDVRVHPAPTLFGSSVRHVEVQAGSWTFTATERLSNYDELVAALTERVSERGHVEGAG